MKNKNETISLYVHIPFCVRKCRYCDFLSMPADAGVIERYLQVLHRDIRYSAAMIQDRVADTVFIGGGTPSILSAQQLQTLLSQIRQAFRLAEDAEFTIETNPGTLSMEKLEAMRQGGVNRLSIGLQAVQEQCLSFLGRIHDYRTFEDNYHLARQAGFDNINIDLMSGIPCLNLAMWKETLEKVIRLKPEHISAYSLIVEEGTPFYEMGDALYDLLPSEDVERQMYAVTGQMLERAGYHRYEISNYSLPGRQCRHNEGYWTGREYLGVGLGAASLYQNCRFRREDNLGAYMEKGVEGKFSRCEEHLLSKREQMEEFVFLGLRLMRGISVREFEARFQVPFMDVYGETAASYLKTGHLKMEGQFLSFTPAGIDVSNRILCEFLL